MVSVKNLMIDATYAYPQLYWLWCSCWNSQWRLVFQRLWRNLHWIHGPMFKLQNLGTREMFWNTKACIETLCLSWLQVLNLINI